MSKRIEEMTVTVDFEFSGISIAPEEMRLVQMVFGDLLCELLAINQYRG